MAFAKKTEVPMHKTQMEIRVMLTKAGAESYATFEERGSAMVAFRLSGRNIRIKIKLVMPNANETANGAKQREQIDRTAWRALKLVIHAKLESVESKIETLEEAFLAHVVMPSGRTVYEEIREPIAIDYKGGNVPLLPGPKS